MYEAKYKGFSLRVPIKGFFHLKALCAGGFIDLLVGKIAREGKQLFQLY